MNLQLIPDSTGGSACVGVREGSVVMGALKRLLPKPVFNSLRMLRQRMLYRQTARLTAYDGDSRSVMQCCIAYNNYGGYCVSTSSRYRPAAQAVLAGKVWEPRTVEFIVGAAGSGDVVHAGTFFGDFLPALSHACADGAMVWAFEPNHESYRCAEMTICINGLKNVMITNAGLGARNELMQIVTTDAHGRSLGGASYIARDNTGRVLGAPVEIVSIDNVVPAERRVAVIHLDVEGFEFPALEGALTTIQKWRPVLVLESLPDQDWLGKNIFSLGYVFDAQIHGNFVLKCK